MNIQNGGRSMRCPPVPGHRYFMLMGWAKALANEYELRQALNRCQQKRSNEGIGNNNDARGRFGILTDEAQDRWADEYKRLYFRQARARKSLYDVVANMGALRFLAHNAKRRLMSSGHYTLDNKEEASQYDPV